MAGKMLIEVSCPAKSGLDLANMGEVGSSLGAHGGLARLASFFGAVDAGIYPAFVRVSTDDSTGVAATITVACTQSSVTAGDQLSFSCDGRIITLTAITTGTQVAGDGTFLAATSDTVTGANLALAIGTFGAAQGFIAGVNASGTVTVSATQLGKKANAWTAISKVTSGTPLVVGNSGAFAGGKEPATKQSVTATFSDHATADDTVIIGGVTFTGKASPSGESQFAVGADGTATATNLTAKVNAHSKLKGLVAATSALGVMTAALQLGGRVGNLVSTGGSCSVLTWSATSFAPSTTEAWASSVVEYRIGPVSP